MLYESKNIVYMLMVLTKLSQRCRVLYFLLYFTQNEKRERIVKASRDVTTSSKKVIFQIHRLSLTPLLERHLKASRMMFPYLSSFLHCKSRGS
jgi:hypothetical protein